MTATTISATAPQTSVTGDVLTALERHDPHTGRHSEAVLLLARCVGVRLGLGGRELEELELAARMHDVGKLAIPLALLRKPGPLTAQERRTIESHSTHGERIVATVTGQATVAAIVRSVHERWDGAGYPDGLAGTEIPHASRVIFACDTYDAITSERPYRVAGAPAEAVQELRRGAGAQFDPGVVDAVIRCLGALGEAPAVERGYPRAARSASSILS